MTPVALRPSQLRRGDVVRDNVGERTVEAVTVGARGSDGDWSIGAWFTDGSYIWVPASATVEVLR